VIQTIWLIIWYSCVGYAMVGLVTLWLLWPWVQFLGWQWRGQILCATCTLLGWPLIWCIWANEVDSLWELPLLGWRLAEQRWYDN